MAATVLLYEMSATNAGTDKTSGTARFKLADDATVDTNDRMQIPEAGTEFSYTKQLRCKVTVMPDTDLTNLQAYSDGAGFGSGIRVGYDVQQTFQTQTDADISGADLFSKTSGDAIDMDSNDTQWLAGDGSGFWGDNLRLQMEVDPSATPGTLTGETLTFAYDET